jgi:hypothetical protein
VVKMSYIPKYILKRMLPADCVKSIEDGIEITFLNVLSPITIEQIPNNVLDYFGSENRWKGDWK